jgi:hypothetical protein
MKYPVTLLITCLTLLTLSFNIQAQTRPITEAKRKAIDSILQQTGAKNALSLMGRQLTGEILTVLKSKNVPMDEDLIKLVDQEARKVIYEDFVLNNQFNEIFYTLYDEYFSVEELQEIARFYNSPTGKRLLAAMPEISRRSLEVSQEKSKGIGYKVQQRLMQRFDEAEQKIQTAQEKEKAAASN